MDPRALPKVELHCHLDGAVRPATLRDLARRVGHPLPADLRVRPDCRTLRDFLRTFDAFYPVLAQPGAMARAAAELLQDAQADGVVHLELRLCPALQAQGAFGAEDVLAEVVAACRHAPISCGVLVCAYRILPFEVNAALVELALRWHGRGVAGLDLAGPEDVAGAPLATLFERARDAGLPITVHAGEAAGPASIREAIDLLHARRLGHAVALKDDPALLARVRDAGVTLECCLTSNLHTGAVASLAEHPFERFRRAGLRVTLNTDDPAVSGITLSGEHELAARTWGYGEAELRAITRHAAEAAFLDEPARRALLALL